ncbi:Protein transport protein SEC16B homolog [Linum grandiflorum]
MTTNPPFQAMEDQIDDDFFDKLVDDDFGPTSSGTGHDKLTEGSDSDEAKAFANLSMEDVTGVDAGAEEVRDDKISSVDDNSGFSGASAEVSDALNLSALSGSANAVDLSNDGLKSEIITQSHPVTDIGSTKLGAKVVDWGSLYADSAANGNHEFGSYSDFFSELGGNSDASPQKVDGSANVEDSAGGKLENSVHYETYQEGIQGPGGHVQQNANEQDSSSSQYWESMYPGWKYDMNTGQWYQVDSYGATEAPQESYDSKRGSEWAAPSDGKGEVNFFQQGSQSVAGTISETSATESVSAWNQVSQESNNGYPEHMIFDPQYPGWYYDTIAQEWRSLESYASSVQQVIPQTLEQHNQNGYGLHSTYSQNGSDVYREFAETEKHGSHGYTSQGQEISRGESHGYTSQGQEISRGESHGSYNQSDPSMWQADSAPKNNFSSDFGQNQQVQNSYGSNALMGNHFDNRKSFNTMGTVPSYEKLRQGHSEGNGFLGSQNFVQSGNFNQQFNQGNVKSEPMYFSNDLYSSTKPMNFTDQSYQNSQQYSYAPTSGRSSAGRPPHALVSFGFGGKLLIMKDDSLANSSFGTQAAVGGSVSVMNLMEVISGNNMDNSSTAGGASCNYFRPLCQQSFPGPLVGGNAGSKDLNKWIDERIANCESPDMDYRKGEVLKLLLSLLKIACKHYGKLRSPFGSDTSLKESDTPESAVAKLFSSAKRNFNEYGGLSHCLQTLPSETQLQATASEVQNLLVSGRKQEALQFAQEGQLWGPALVLASQLGQQFYIDTVKQMALRQLLPGSPLRTLCLLIAGQPAEVFSSDTKSSGGPVIAASGTPQPLQPGPNSMLDDWEQNLALITANRTKDDELVIIHLGDCLWKDRSEITAAHICYLVAEANFETYSDSARLCLIGADHWKHPRTFASPEAIQRTELYEYSKVLGNSQFILLPFQPYKLVYAYMLAEVGRVSDSLKYCQAVLKSLKTGRAPEVETWKQLVSSLEERIRIHQQGGYAANLAPAKLVGKLLNFFDSTAHRVVGGLPPPAPSTSQGVHSYDHDQQSMAPRVAASQSTMAMSTLVPSASMEPISEWAADGNRMGRHSRSVSEPDFGRTPRQGQADPSTGASTSSSQDKASSSPGVSRLGRFAFGSQLLQKTVDLVLRPRSDKQAKLGEKNKFYYDEKLKRWVEEGVDPPAEEAALPPPPTSAVFQNGASDYNLKSALKNEGSPPSGSPKFRSPATQEHSSGMPPIPTGGNQFSARGRMGVRARYVDTFNQGGGKAANLFHSPPLPSAKPAAPMNPKFFVPAPAPSTDYAAENVEDNVAASEIPQTTSMEHNSFQPPASSSPMVMQRFPSMDNMQRGSVGGVNNNGGANPQSRRTASWSGSFNSSISPPGTGETQSSFGMPATSFMAVEPPAMTRVPTNGSSFGDLQEVEL